MVTALKDQQSLPLTGALEFRRTDGSVVTFRCGRGGLVYDDRGQPYVDFVLGMGPVSIGHANPRFTHRMVDALERGMLFPGFCDDHARYCAHLEAATPGASVVALFKTGSECVAGAMRIAAIRTGRSGVIRCGYTGWHDAQLACSPAWNEHVSSPARQQIRFEKSLRGVGTDEPVANWIDMKLDSLQDLVESGRFGAFVLDMYQVEMVSPQVTLDAVALCRDRGLVVVLDETKTAGRRGCAGAYAGTAVRGDLTVLGKAIGNGFPIAVLLQHSRFDWEVRQTRIGGTYSKEALSVRAALATAEVMAEVDGYAVLARTGMRLATVLNDAAASAGVGDEVRTAPLLEGRLFEFRYSPRLQTDRQARHALEQSFLAQGMLLFEGHCSFVCVDHDSLDWAALGALATAAFAAWERECGAGRS